MDGIPDVGEVAPAVLTIAEARDGAVLVQSGKRAVTRHEEHVPRSARRALRVATPCHDASRDVEGRKTVRVSYDRRVIAARWGVIGVAAMVRVPPCDD